MLERLTLVHKQLTCDVLGDSLRLFFDGGEITLFLKKIYESVLNQFIT